MVYRLVTTGIIKQKMDKILKRNMVEGLFKAFVNVLEKGAIYILERIILKQ